MKISETIKPISYLKAHAADIIRNFANNEKTYIITQNGEAKAVLQDIKTYESLQESLLLLKIVALSTENLHQGNVKPLKKAFSDLRARIKNTSFIDTFIYEN